MSFEDYITLEEMLWKVVNSLPLRAFDKAPVDIDAADFVDHSSSFIEAMNWARAAQKRQKEIA